MGILIFSSLPFIVSSPAQAKEVWEGQGLEWYYDNLTDEDRLKIRQAMDYAIPRGQIIDGLWDGYVLPLATDITSNMVGYDTSIRVRDQNLTKSKELLVKVFGKRYENSSIAAANTTITNTPYFNITLASPVSSAVRAQWAALVANNFRQIGIEVELKWWNWNIIMPRIFFDPPGIGLNHAHGGFDALCVGTGVTPDPDLRKKYFQTQFVPEGENYQWIANLELEKIVNESLTDLDLTRRLKALTDFQVWFFEWVPKSIIFQPVDYFPQNSQLTGFDPYNYGREPWVHNVSHPSKTTFTSVVPGKFKDFNPILSTSWYDSVWQSNIHLSLTGRHGSYNLTHPVGQVAKNWTSSSNDLSWTVTLRKGLKFHDGSEVTSDDVVFSYKVARECPDSCWAEDMTNWFKSSNNIQKIDDYTVQFTFSHFFPYITSQSFTVPILSKTQLESIAFADWKTHETNLGSVPLLGCGPYEFIEFDEEKKVICHKAATWNASLMSHDSAAPGGGIWLENMGPTTYIIEFDDDLASAVSKLHAGIVDLIDYEFGAWNLMKELEVSDWVKVIAYPDYGYYEIGYNHYDPRWGLNPHDPRDMYP